MLDPRTIEDDIMYEWNYEDAFDVLDGFTRQFLIVSPGNPPSSVTIVSVCLACLFTTAITWA